MCVCVCVCMYVCVCARVCVTIDVHYGFMKTVHLVVLNNRIKNIQLVSQCTTNL